MKNGKYCEEVSCSKTSTSSSKPSRKMSIILMQSIEVVNVISYWIFLSEVEVLEDNISFHLYFGRSVVFCATFSCLWWRGTEKDVLYSSCSLYSDLLCVLSTNRAAWSCINHGNMPCLGCHKNCVHGLIFCWNILQYKVFIYIYTVIWLWQNVSKNISVCCADIGL